MPVVFMVCLFAPVNTKNAFCSPVPGPPVTSIGFMYDDDDVSNVSYEVYGYDMNSVAYWDPGTWTSDPQQAIWLSRYYGSLIVYYKYLNHETGTYCYGSEAFSGYGSELIYCLVHIVPPQT